MAARQAGVNQGQTIRVDQQVRVGDDIGDEVDVRDDFHNSLFFGRFAWKGFFEYSTEQKCYNTSD